MILAYVNFFRKRTSTSFYTSWTVIDVNQEDRTTVVLQELKITPLAGNSRKCKTVSIMFRTKKSVNRRHQVKQTLMFHDKGCFLPISSTENGRATETDTFAHAQCWTADLGDSGRNP